MAEKGLGAFLGIFMQTAFLTSRLKEMDFMQEIMVLKREFYIETLINRGDFRSKKTFSEAKTFV